MKIAILNDVHIGRALEYKGKFRAASHLAESILPQVLLDIMELHVPDLIVNLGDLIRRDSKEVDLINYRQALRHFKGLSCPVIHLLGNHEIRNLSATLIEYEWERAGFLQSSYGALHFGEARIVWLGIDADKGNHQIRRLPNEQLTWLKGILLEECSVPTLLFTHCGIDDHDVRGNYFVEAFDAPRESLFLENQFEIRKAIADSNAIRGVFQAHLHHFHCKFIDGIPYVTCPAMGDNICGPGVHLNFPEIYTIVTLEQGNLIVKAYSREFSFAGTESSCSSF